MRVSLRQLEIILAVAETRSVSAAAKHLNISQPAVTRYVREVEQSQGLSLFDRTTRGMATTTAGLTFLHRARAIAAELRALDHDAQALRGSSAGRLSIGVTPAVPALVPRIVARLLADTPDVAVDIVEDMRPKLLPALRAGELDLVLATQPPEGPGDGLTDRILFENRLSIVARWDHPLASSQRIQASELHQWVWVLPSADLAPRQQLEAALHRVNAPLPRRIVSTDSVKMQREILLSGEFLAVLVRQSVQHDVDLKLIRLLDVELVLPLRPIVLITRRSVEASPMVLRFSKLLQQELDGQTRGTRPAYSLSCASQIV